MNFMKKHKIKLILLGVFILVFIIALFALVSLLYPDSRKDAYGNRLAGINDVKISNQSITEIKDEMNSNGIVEKIDYVLKGRLINFIISVKEDTKVEDSKKIVNSITEAFEKEILSYYDIQIIIKVNSETSEKYPIFAYKHKTSNEFVWAKN